MRFAFVGCKTIAPFNCEANTHAELGRRTVRGRQQALGEGTAGTTARAGGGQRWLARSPRTQGQAGMQVNPDVGGPPAVSKKKPSLTASATLTFPSPSPRGLENLVL